MKRAMIGVAIVLGILSVPSIVQAGADRPEAVERIVQFSTMFGVDGAFVGETNPVRGLLGDEFPWEIEGSASGYLDTSGHLKIHIRGLVFANDPSVPRNLRGKNDDDSFRGVVSCLTEDPQGAVVVSNVVTEGFPATVPEGDSEIDAYVDLPNPCVAPVIFVLSGSEDFWFASTGFEIEE